VNCEKSIYALYAVTLDKGVGSGVAVFTGRILTEQLKFKLDNMCSNSQDEQLAIVWALDVIETQQVIHNESTRQQLSTRTSR